MWSQKWGVICGFIIRKPHISHCTLNLYIYIYIYIFNIKYIINSLITLVFQKKKKKFNNPNKCWLGKSAQNKEKLVQ